MPIFNFIRRCYVYLFDFIGISMLKYQSAATASSPLINSNFFANRLTSTSHKPQIPSQKEQIDSIRTIAKMLLEEESDSTVTFEEKNRPIHHKKLNIYKRAQLNEQKKLEKIVTAHKEEAKKILELSKTSANSLNVTKTNLTAKSRQAQDQTKSNKNTNKQSYMLKEVLKKCIKEEVQLHIVKQKLKKQKCTQSNPYLNNTYIERPKKGKKTATKQQLQQIFEEVNKRGIQLKRRRQNKVQNYLEQRYEREMKGVTFQPQLHSSKSLRNNCVAGFQERLKQDHKDRQWQKLQILTQQLRRDSFEPRLNNHRNSLSKSKIHSFRAEDSAFFTTRSKPELTFEKNLSRFIYPEEDSLAESRTNQSLEIAMKASQLNFLFQ